MKDEGTQEEGMEDKTVMFSPEISLIKSQTLHAIVLDTVSIAEKHGAFANITTLMRKFPGSPRERARL